MIVKLHRVEGPAHAAPRRKKAYSFDQANVALFLWSESAPGEGEGVHKVDITLPDVGLKLTYGLSRHGYPNLKRWVEETCRFYLGEWRPPNVTEEQQRAMLAQQDASFVETCRRALPLVAKST